MEDNKTYAHYGDDSRDFYTLIQEITSQAEQLESVILCNIGFNRENISRSHIEDPQGSNSDEEDSQNNEEKKKNNIIPALSDALKKCVNLTRLTLSDVALHSNIEDDDLDRLADALESLKNLSNIGIYNLLKTQEDNNTNLRFLNYVLRACTQISMLQLEDNDVTLWSDLMWVTMGKLFNSLKKLSHFSLKDEVFSEECLEKFCLAIDGIRESTVETFTIEWQECPTPKGMEMLGDSLSKMPSLKNLNFGLLDDETIKDAIGLLKKFKHLNSVSLFVAKLSDQNLDLLRDTLITLKPSMVVLRLEEDFMTEHELKAMINKLDTDQDWPDHEIETLTYNTSPYHTPIKKSPFTKTTLLFSETPGRTPKYLRDIIATVKAHTEKKQKTVSTPASEHDHPILDHLSSFALQNTEAPSTTSKRLLFESVSHEESLHDTTINFIRLLSFEFQTSTEFVNTVNIIYPLIEDLLEPITFKVISSAVFYAEFPNETKEEIKARTHLARSLALLQYQKAMLNDSHIGRVETQAKNLARSHAYQGREDQSPTPIISRYKRKNGEALVKEKEAPPLKKEKLDSIESSHSLAASSKKHESRTNIKTKIFDESIGSDDFEKILQIIFADANQVQISSILDVMMKLSAHAQQSKTKKEEINEFIQDVMRLQNPAQFVQHISESLSHYADRQKNALLKNTGSGLYRFSNIFFKKHLNPMAIENIAKRFSQYSSSTTEDLLIDLYEAVQHCESPEHGL